MEATLSKGQNTRQRIVRHAASLMHSKGYFHTSIDDVLKDAQVKKGSFYFHFSSKEELGFAVVDHASEYIIGTFRDIAAMQELSPEDRLLRILEVTRSLAEETDCTRGCILGNLAIELSDTHDGFRRRIEESFRAWILLYAGLLEELRSAGSLPERIDPMDHATCMVAALEGGILLSKLNRDRRPLSLTVDRLAGELREMIEEAPKRKTD